MDGEYLNLTQICGYLNQKNGSIPIYIMILYIIYVLVNYLIIYVLHTYDTKFYIYIYFTYIYIYDNYSRSSIS